MVNRGFRLNLGQRMIIVDSLWAIFIVSCILEIARVVEKVGLSLKSNLQIKLRLSKSLNTMLSSKKTKLVSVIGFK